MTEVPSMTPQEQKEYDYYRDLLGGDYEIDLPITRVGFETLLAEAAGISGFPVDDDSRALLCGFIHQIDRSIDKTTIAKICSALRKQLSNGITMTIYNEIDQKRRAERANQKNTLALAPEMIDVPVSDGPTSA